MFTIPNAANAAFPAQADICQADLDILVGAYFGTGIIGTGAVVTAQGSPNNTVAIAAGTGSIQGTSFAISSGNSPTFSTADATNPRIDLVVSNSSGTISILAGTPAATPVMPDVTKDGNGDITVLVLASVYIPATGGAPSIASSNIIDKRVTLQPTGTAGGDLTSKYPNPTVAKIRGTTVSSTAPTTDQVLVYDGSTQYTPQLGLGVNLARMTCMGHSYLAEMGVGPYGSEFPSNQAMPSNGAGFGKLLANMLGVRTDKRFVSAVVPAVAAGSDAQTAIAVFPEDTLIEGAWYVPSATITGASTNNRTISINISALLGQTAVGFQQFISGTNATAWQPFVLVNLPGALLAPVSQFYKSAVTNAGNTSPYWPGVNPYLGTSWTNPTCISFQSTHIGTGIADPGGVVILRLGGSYRSTAVGASQLMLSGNTLGGWSTCWEFGQPWPVAPGPEVNVTTAIASGSSVTIQCDSLPENIIAGSTVRFSSGAIAQNISAASRGATSIVAGTLTRAVVAGDQGHAAVYDATINFDSQTSTGLSVFCYGINDAGTVASPDRVAWRETVRAMVSKAMCKYFQKANASNHQYVNGNGGGSWATSIPSAGGQIMGWDQQGLAINTKVFTGAVGTSTPSTITIRTSPSFEGGTIALFFMALAGSGATGAKATITVDGGTPPQGTVIYDGTQSGGGYAPTANATTVSITTVNGSKGFSAGSIPVSNVDKIITGTNIPAGTLVAVSRATAADGHTNTNTSITSATGQFSSADVGSFITSDGGDIPAGTTIATVTNATTATISQAATATNTTRTFTIFNPALSANATGSSAITANLLGYTPVVKRLTGLSSGAHTITITLNSIDATDGSARFTYLGYGIEDSGAMVAWANIARILNTASYTAGASTNTNVSNLNTDTTNVFAGTAAAVGTANTEPALPSSAVIVDIDTALGLNALNFCSDGIHPNTRGTRLVAAAFYRAIRNIATTTEMASR